jgi:hypothetical protein
VTTKAAAVQFSAPEAVQAPTPRHVQRDGSVAFAGPNLRVRLAVLKPGFVLITVVGEASGAEDAAVEQAVLREMDLEIEQSGMLTIFCDLRELSRMGPASREKFGRWGKRHQKRINASHVLIRSKLIEVATTLINALAGGVLRTYSSPRTFLAQLHTVAPKVTKLPEF